MRWWAASFAKHDDGDMNLLSACRQTARRTFRIQNLRPEQESAMLAVLNGRDALVSLPTGFGKPLIYQVPAIIVERPTIVISPLIPLMTDQEHALRKRGVPVVELHSRLRATERRTALERLKKGGRLVVLTTPETLESAATARLFERARPALCALMKPTASRNGGTTSGPPICVSEALGSAWGIRRCLHSRQRQRRESAKILPNGSGCRSTAACHQV